MLGEVTKTKLKRRRKVTIPKKKKNIINNMSRELISCNKRGGLFKKKKMEKVIKMSPYIYRYILTHSYIHIHSFSYQFSSNEKNKKK